MTVTEILANAGVPFEHKETDNVYVECPECGKLNLSISVFSGVWHCWTTDCEEKGIRGVFPLLAEKLGVTFQGEFTATEAPPSKDKTLREEDADRILHANSNKPEVIEWAASRGLDSTFLLKMGVGYDKNVRAIVLPFRDENGRLVGAKYRGDNGDQWIKGVCPDLYILDPADLSSPKIVIVEGEVDALTLKQLGIPCVATLGAGKEKGFRSLGSARQIYLGYDMDAAGEAGVNKALAYFGANKCRRIEWLDKDPNDMLKAGAPHEDILECIKQAKSLATNLKSKSGKDAMSEFIRGLNKEERKRRSWGYPRLDSLTKGYGGGETIGILAEAGTGKTSFIINATGNARRQGMQVGIASLEEHVVYEMTPKLMSNAIGRNLGIVSTMTEEETQIAERMMAGIHFYPGDGDIVELVEWIRECYYVHGVKVIAVDYLQLLMTDEKDVQQVKDVCYTFKKLVKECPELTIWLIIQPKQKQRMRSAKTGEEIKGLKLEGSDARGGSAINQSVDKLLTITGLPSNPNLTQYEYTKVRGHLHVAKRDWLNKFTQLEYDHATLRMTEVQHMVYGGA